MASSRATPRPCSSPPSPPFHLRTAATKQPPTRVSKQTVKMHSSRFERLAARGRAQSSGAHQPAGTARRLSRRQQHAEHSKTWHAAAAADPCRSASNLVLDKTAPTATVPRATSPSVPSALARDGDWQRWHAGQNSSRTEHRQLGAAAHGQAERRGSTHPIFLQPLSRLVAAVLPPSPRAAPKRAVIQRFQPFSPRGAFFPARARGACGRRRFMHSHNTCRSCTCIECTRYPLERPLVNSCNLHVSLS